MPFFTLCCFFVVQSLCSAQLCNPMDCSTPGFPIFHYILKFSQIHVYWVNDMSRASHPFLLPSLLPSIFLSIRVFSNELALCSRWPKYWSFSFSISSFIEFSRLISFRIKWFDFFAVQGTLKSFLQHCSLKASILQCSAFFMIQLSHPYMTTGKTITMTIWRTFVSNVPVF